MVNAYLEALGAHGSQRFGQYMGLLQIQENDNANDEIIGSARCLRNMWTDSERDPSRAQGESDGGEVNETPTQSLSDFNGTEDSSANREFVQTVGEDPDVKLTKVGVELRMETLLEYEPESFDIDGSLDFSIADPLEKIGSNRSDKGRSSQCSQHSRVLDELVNEEGVTMYVQSVRRLLKRGGFCYVFLDWNRIQQWKTCCIESQFEVVCEPFLIMRDPKRFQKMTLAGLQSMCEPALVLCKFGDHPVAFTMYEKSPYTHLPVCRMQRWCNVIDGVPPAPQKVTFKPSRAQVRPNEKPCSLYIELLQTFCPALGKVLDLFAGTLTTALAYMAIGRQFFLLETDQNCIEYSKPRAVEFPHSRAMHNNSILDKVRERSGDDDIVTPQRDLPMDGEGTSQAESYNDSDAFKSIFIMSTYMRGG